MWVCTDLFRISNPECNVIEAVEFSAQWLKKDKFLKLNFLIDNAESTLDGYISAYDEEQMQTNHLFLEGLKCHNF